MKNMKNIYWDEKTKKYIHVGKGPSGNYSFYRTSNLKVQGSRVRGLDKNKKERWFPTRIEAEKALPSFAKKREFIPEIFRTNKNDHYDRSGTTPAWWPKA